MSTTAATTSTIRTLAGKTVDDIRKIFFETITEDDIKKMFRKLVDIASEGNFAAIKFVLPYLIGKPGQTPTMEELNHAARHNARLGQSKSKWDAGLPPISASDFVAAGRSPTPGDASEIRLANNVRGKNAASKHGKRK